MTHDHDVIIVGGRISGSSLALRLGQAGLRVLLLERDRLPSRPAASSPIIYSPAMRLLDELNIPETAYAAHTPPIPRWIIEAENTFRVEQPVPDVHGRAYAYAIDRGRFDAALWDAAARTPGVTARQRAAVTDLLWDGEKVSGVRVKDLDGGETEAVTAPLVVGADGRFSLVGRKAGADIYDEHTAQPTSIYYAYWCDVQPADDHGPAAHLISPGGDYGLLLADSADGSTVVVVEGRADVINPGSDGADAFYTAFLRRHPAVWARLQHAQRITPVRGMKRVGNGYRTAGGPGWALVGDAVHQKDPLDGQGIYDALFTAKVLAAVVAKWHTGAVSWEAALADYTAAMREETRPMYRSTLARVEREIYTHYPDWFMHSLARWLYADPVYRERWARLLTRSIDPAAWYTVPGAALGTVRGLWHTLRQTTTADN